MKTSNYDGIGHNLKWLAKIIKAKDQLIKKSQDGEQQYDDYVGKMGTAIYNQFLQIKSDFYGGRINQAVYTDLLRKMADELTREIKIDVPELHVQEIIAEIKRFIQIA